MPDDIRTIVQSPIDSIERFAGIPVWALLLIAFVICGIIAAVFTLRDRLHPEKSTRNILYRPSKVPVGIENLEQSKLVPDNDVSDFIFDETIGVAEDNIDKGDNPILDEPIEKAGNYPTRLEELEGMTEDIAIEVTDFKEDGAEGTASCPLPLEEDAPPSLYNVDDRGYIVLDVVNAAPDKSKQNPDSALEGADYISQSILVDDPRPDALPSSKIEVIIPTKKEQ